MSTSPRVAIYTRVAKKIESNHRAAALVVGARIGAAG
jgi:hypothetical protein